MPPKNARRPVLGKYQESQATSDPRVVDSKDSISNLNESSASLNAGARGARGGSRGSTAMAISSRFKPKNVRRSAIELADIAKKEEIKRAAAMAEYAKQQARLARGRGRQRGRGDMMGRVRGATTSANSIFGIAPEGLKKESGMMSIRNSGAGGSGVGRSSTSTSIKREAGNYSASDGLGRSGISSTNNFAPQYPGEDEDIIRVDIEHINIISDDEEEANSNDADYSINLNKEKTNTKGGLRPVRLFREEHKERSTVVKTTSDTPEQSMPAQSTTDTREDSDEGLFVTDGTRSSFGLATGKLEPKIKQEPILDETIDDFPLPSLHDALDVSTQLVQPDKNRVSKPKSERDQKQGKKQSTNKNINFVIQTEEDRAEYERHLVDLEILANELGSLQEFTSTKIQDFDGDKIIEKTEDLEEEQDKKDGRLYLFQFPPVLPPLFNPLTEEKLDSSIIVKNEFNEPTQELETIGNSIAGKGDAREVDSTAQLSAAIKLEVEDKSIDQKENISKRTEIIHEEGFIGKLIVRESGKVELCWGGTRLLVGRGVDAKFLTTGVIVDNVEIGPAGGGVPEGKAFGMGQIMGKFVVTPDWMSMI
ncbi:DNA-directed RNA polymerase III RPC4 [Erysiphe neolycopersici]|uniref:DNA-directed RNA polymerase III RPC4 n=1 Tax=Erysiphe neolycopersici TaxID=212602 RepID=A0A420HM87_9PEZI|nr:DNA-directed RNA polymerase III RPC4 [Erysiphe neolycopersici]